MQYAMMIKTYAEKMKALILQTFQLPQPVECVIYLNQEQILKYYREDKIDIIFMDIEFGDVIGFQVARRLSMQDSQLAVVYMTIMSIISQKPLYADRWGLSEKAMQRTICKLQGRKFGGSSDRNTAGLCLAAGRQLWKFRCIKFMRWKSTDMIW